MNEKEKEKTQHMRAEYLKLEDEKDAWKGLQKETERIEEQEEFRFMQSKRSIEDMREACSAQDHVMIQLLERQQDLLHVLKRNREEFREMFENKKKNRLMDIEEEQRQIRGKINASETKNK